MQKPINAGAKYIVLNRNGIKTLVDMRDIEDIQLIQKVKFDNTDKVINIYAVFFDNNTYWQVPISEETLKIYENFKNKKKKKSEEK